MRKVFAKTQNVKNFISLMNNLQNRPENIPGMALVYGEPGLGKTQTVLWWATQNNTVYIRATSLMSGRWLLQELVEELGEVPYFFSADLFKQCIKLLKEEKRIIIIDEVDYLTSNDQLIEVVRDLHDQTNTSIVLIGMSMADKKLMRYRHLYDRISEKLKFVPFSFEDVKAIIEQLCEVEMSECAVKFIYGKYNRFRQIVKILNKAEHIAFANGLKVIDETTLKEVIDDDLFENNKVSQAS